MNVKPAELTPKLVTQLEEFEQELREQSSENIVVIAYQIEADHHSEVLEGQ